MAELKNLEIPKFKKISSLTLPELKGERTANLTRQTLLLARYNIKVAEAKKAIANKYGEDFETKHKLTNTDILHATNDIATINHTISKIGAFTTDAQKLKEIFILLDHFDVDTALLRYVMDRNNQIAKDKEAKKLSDLLFAYEERLKQINAEIEKRTQRGKVRRQASHIEEEEEEEEQEDE